MKKISRCLSMAVITMFVLAVFNPTSADQQTKRILTAEDYAQAEKFLRQHTNALVSGTSIRPNWIDENSFWYRNNMPEGYEFVQVDAKKKQRKRAFDHEKLASALSKAANMSYKPFKLPFQSIKFSENKKSVIFAVGAWIRQRGI